MQCKLPATNQLPWQSIQLDLLSGTTCRQTSDSRTCNNAFSYGTEDICICIETEAQCDTPFYLHLRILLPTYLSTYKLQPTESNVTTYHALAQQKQNPCVIGPISGSVICASTQQCRCRYVVALLHVQLLTQCNIAKNTITIIINICKQNFPSVVWIMRAKNQVKNIYYYYYYYSLRPKAAQHMNKKAYRVLGTQTLSGSVTRTNFLFLQIVKLKTYVYEQINVERSGTDNASGYSARTSSTFCNQ